ncbi:Multidrug resistance protein [Dissulfuribacter thermophilus]|uniref:Multidrug resistance protein n=1 Tax=Dissulfuribacter thermophilus TaxID=1156395 RepID=A0A1B9F3C0_9BACT|nr:HlyD family secretion protein [Dissulfuribacter thermophilus]OCC14426.1 Multidrug resistance protein [Dissulfuribacter thermophilus]
MGKRVATFILIIGVLCLVTFTIIFVVHRMHYAVTDAVFVRTDSLINLGFDHVSGRIIELSKKEGDTVKKGEVIARLDDRNFKNRLDALKAKLRAEQKKKEELGLRLLRVEKELELNQRIARQSVDELTKKKASLEERAKALEVVIEDLKRDNERYSNLFKKGVVPKKTLESITTKLKAQKRKYLSTLKEIDAIKASIKKAEENLDLAKVKRAKTKELQKAFEAVEESISAIKAEIKIAQKDLNECTLRSTIDGRVAKRYVSEGDVVLPGRTIYSLVDPKDVYILVLLEEGKIHGVKPGSPATIHIDAYPDETFKGVVESVLPASSATFALIPRDVSAGEFTKVAQRIPIRIKITEGKLHLLKVGLGGEVEIKRL